jgi:hypothetical protein
LAPLSGIHADKPKSPCSNVSTASTIAAGGTQLLAEKARYDLSEGRHEKGKESGLFSDKSKATVAVRIPIAGETDG